jgi:hypothetical protein
MIKILKKYSEIINYPIKIIICVMALSNFVGCQRHLTDEEMIRQFYEHNDEFKQLLVMMKSEKNMYGHPISSGWLMKNDDIDKNRVKEYRSLMKKVKLSSISVNNEKNYFFFDKTYTGIIAIRSSRKGYFYTEKEESDLVDNLDTYVSPRRHDFIARRIDKNWYIFLEE